MLIFFFLPFFSSLIWSGAASAEAPRPPREATWETRFTLSYFDTTENFTSNGRETLLNGGEYTNLLGDFRFTYDWQPDWRFYASLNIVRADSALASNSGVNELMAGAQKWYEAGKFDIAVEGEFVYPVWRVDEASDAPLLGEGAMRAKGGSWAFLPLGKIKPFAYVGFEYRDEGRASVIPYNLGVKGRIQRIWVQGELRGYERIIDDKDSGNIVERLNNAAFLQMADSGSTRYYAINPSYSELAMEAGTRFGDWGLFAGAAYSVNGKNTAAGWTGYGGVAFSPKAMHRPNERRDEIFDPRNERYDENVFRESSPNIPPPAEEPAAPEFSEQIPPEPSAPPSDSPRSAAPPEVTEPPPKVEMQLQLRRVKKKPKTSKKLQNMMNDTEKFLEKGK
jgi:hypothetical protein